MPRDTICRLALALALSTGAATAGPWPREVKTTFLSLSTERDRDDNSYTGLYGEYGLTPRQTLGFELGHTNQGESSAMVWLQHALDDGKGANRYSIAAGIGAIDRDGELLPVGQIAANWGRGIERLPGGGWLTIEGRVKVAGKMESAGDARGEVSYLTPEMTVKAEVTLGMRPTERMMFINQIRFEDRDDSDFSAKFASSVVHDLIGPAKIEVGVIAPVTGPGETAIKIGTWLQF